MRIIRCRNYEDMGKKAANLIGATVIRKPDCVLGLATGSTPLGIYASLIERYQDKDLDFSAVKSVNLDEYKGLGEDNPQSYRYYMKENFFRHINIRPENTHLPDGLEPDSAKACADYDAVIASMGQVDLQLLGLGHDGHIGFNEPNQYFDKETHCVDLAPMTIEANKRFFASADEVPRQAYTMGIAAILRARCVLLAVSGRDKAKILKEALTGPITPEVPASALQFHPNVVVVADEDALSLF